ncbi:MAG: hypothetical protein GXY72_10350 [Deltaproteobacteria bacterium]|nr:hypothetical protein [Deltaproteobacteria bacterium]
MKKENIRRLIVGIETFSLATLFLLHVSDGWSVIAVVACVATLIAKKAQGER